MTPQELIIKCYAEKQHDCWVAVCLDFTLAAQGDSYDEVKTKLEAMITEYVYDALVGEDKQYASQLLSRTAPLSSWVKYYLILIKNVLFHGDGRTFAETMPLRPA